MHATLTETVRRVADDRRLLRWGMIAVVAWLLLRGLRNSFWTLFGLFWAFHWML